MKSLRITLLATIFVGFTSSIALADPPGNFTNEKPQMGKIVVDPVSETFKKAWKEVGGEVATESNGASNSPGNSSNSGDRPNDGNSSDGGENGNTPE